MRSRDEECNAKCLKRKGHILKVERRKSREKYQMMRSLRMASACHAGEGARAGFPSKPIFRVRSSERTTKNGSDGGILSKQGEALPVDGFMERQEQFRHNSFFFSSSSSSSSSSSLAEEQWQGNNSRAFKKGWNLPEFERRESKERVAAAAMSGSSDGNSCRRESGIINLCKEGKLKEALDMVEAMLKQGYRPLSVSTFGYLLKECSRLKSLSEGKKVHALIHTSGLESNIFLGNTAVDMYTKCGSVTDARQVFDNMPKRNVFSWNIIISAYAKHGQGGGEEALLLFERMREDVRVKPDKFTYASVLKACTILAFLEKGKEIHGDIEKLGFEKETFMGVALIDMYMKCGSDKEARRVFDGMFDRNVVAWNAVIAGYSQCDGCGEEALGLFDRMQSEGIGRGRGGGSVKPNAVTCVSALKACGGLASLTRGKKIHAYIKEAGVEEDVFVKSALVDMYAKCGNIEYARRVFNGMYMRDVAAWNAMITGCAQHGHGNEALELFEQMQTSNVLPNSVTFVGVLKACSGLAALDTGKQLHSILKQNRLESNIFIANTLIDMYAKCGSIADARLAFDEMGETRDLVSWNAMIAGYAQHGHAKEAIEFYKQMQNEGLNPNEATYTSIFSACCHAGLVDECRYLFNSMSQEHGITPTSEHYSCIIDLLGRMGHLAEAEDYINKMPIQPHAAIWKVLLMACSIHRNAELGRRAFEHIIRMEPKNAASYVVLSNIYASLGMWEDVEKLRIEMRDAGMKEESSELRLAG